jgi:hypothetical protein
LGGNHLLHDPRWGGAQLGIIVGMPVWSIWRAGSKRHPLLLDLDNVR